MLALLRHQDKGEREKKKGKKKKGGKGARDSARFYGKTSSAYMQFVWSNRVDFMETAQTLEEGGKKKGGKDEKGIGGEDSILLMAPSFCTQPPIWDLRLYSLPYHQSQGEEKEREKKTKRAAMNLAAGLASLASSFLPEACVWTAQYSQSTVGGGEERKKRKKG